MTGFKPDISGMGSDRSASFATITALQTMPFRFSHFKSPFFVYFQLPELRVADDEEASTVRGRSKAADGATQAKLRGHEDVCPVAHRRKTNFEQNFEGNTVPQLVWNRFII